jgi:hypothetical protein
MVWFAKNLLPILSSAGSASAEDIQIYFYRARIKQSGFAGLLFCIVAV